MANNASYWPLDYPPLSGYQVRKCTLSLDSTACIMRTQQVPSLVRQPHSVWCRATLAHWHDAALAAEPKGCCNLRCIWDRTLLAPVKQQIARPMCIHLEPTLPPCSLACAELGARPADQAV